MRLPKLPNRIRHSQPQTIQFGGLNLTATARDGEFVDCNGVTTFDYPHLTQQYTPIDVTGEYNEPKMVFEYGDDLFVIDDDGLKRNGELIYEYIGWSFNYAEVGCVVVNTKLVIWAAGIYVDLTDNSIHRLEKKVIHDTSGYTVSGDTITYTNSVTGEKIGDLFSVGDVVDVYYESTAGGGEIGEGKRIIVETASDDTITFAAGSITYRDPTQYEIDRGLVNTLWVHWSLPSLDFVCESGNRLWGCSNDEGTIFVSALGDPTDFFHYTSDLGAFSTAVSSSGSFTGICAYSGAVLVWKEDRLYKVLGSYPSEYYTVESVIPGVSYQSQRSQVIINGLLYYLGQNGNVYVYGGNRPSVISDNIRSGYYAGLASTDGRFYYVWLQNIVSGNYLYVYDVLRQLWVRHDLSDGVEDHYAFITSMSAKYYILTIYDDLGNVISTKLNRIAVEGEYEASVSRDTPWHAELTEVTENTFNRKGYTKILLRVDMTEGSSMRVLAKEDRRAYREVWKHDTVTEVDLLNEDLTISGGPATFTNNEKYKSVSDWESVIVVLDDVFAPTSPDYDPSTETMTAYFEDEIVVVDFSASTVTVQDRVTGDVIDGQYSLRVFDEIIEDDLVTMTIPIRLGRCDRYQIKLEGTGAVTVLAMGREFVTGSDIN